MHNNKTIAVDFDGTIVENRYPKIGKPILFALETLLHLQKEGHLLILWTYRSGKELQEAVEFCKQKGIVFYAVNKSYPEELYDESLSRKIQADIFIDDRNIGGLRGWGEIYHELSSSPEKAKFTNKKKKEKSGKRILNYIKSKL
ncbi:BT0820 family HAD-type phosphatase [Gillisia hiemivivida]|uniref:Hydrolase n=1 Tax=Gillisia hiemivivida TaxID=291190 RepID=A0A5C6ZQK1_9FLAO|nr:hydrolase [Gillisia hiemivivida]TXD92614.1 hydrolase [Gillisia hiemivivida]